MTYVFFYQTFDGREYEIEVKSDSLSQAQHLAYSELPADADKDTLELAEEVPDEEPPTATERAQYLRDNL
jgi:hypothetical protein